MTLKVSTKYPDTFVKLVENKSDPCSISTEVFLNQQEWDLFDYVKTSNVIVADAFKNYNRSILEEKNKQKTAIKILSDHIRDISNEMKTDDYKLNRVKGDQRILLDELQNIRNELRQALALNGRKNEYISSDEDEYN